MAKVGIIATKKWVISLINAVLKKQKNPWDWTPGVVQDLGGGLYGVRYTGTISNPADKVAEITVDNNFDASKNRIVDAGGTWCYAEAAVSGGPTDAFMQFGQAWWGDNNNGDKHFSSFDLFDNKLVFSTVSHSPRTNASYDIWVKYIKQ